MSFLDTLFGGGGGDIPPTSKLRNLDITPDVFKNLQGQIANLIGGATTGTTLNMAGVPAAPGPYAAPMTGNEGALIGALFGRTGEGVPTAGFDPTLAGFAAGNTPLQQAGQADLLKTIGGGYLDPGTNPFLAKTIESAIAPLRAEWQNTILPNLKIGFSKAGQTITGFGSSPFDRAEALAANEYTRKVGDIGTQIASANYENERNRMLTALGLGEQATGQQIGAQTAGLGAQQAAQAQNAAERAQKTQELVTTLQAVALPRLIQQYGIDVGTEEFRNRLNSLLQLLNMEAGLAGGTTIQGAVGLGSQPQQGILGSLIGAGGQMGAAALMPAEAA